MATDSTNPLDIVAEAVSRFPQGITHSNLMDLLDAEGNSKAKSQVRSAKLQGLIKGETIQAAEGEKPVLWYRSTT